MGGTRGAFTPVPQRTVINTNASGNATWTYPSPYLAVPRVVFSCGPSADTALVEARITALSATQVTVNVRRAPSVTVAGIAVLSAPQAAPNVPVQIVAFSALIG